MTLPAAIATIPAVFTPATFTSPPPVDAWRWAGCVGFDAYKSHVLAAEAARASRAA